MAKFNHNKSLPSPLKVALRAAEAEAAAKAAEKKAAAKAAALKVAEAREAIYLANRAKEAKRAEARKANKLDRKIQRKTGLRASAVSSKELRSELEALWL